MELRLYLFASVLTCFLGSTTSQKIVCERTIKETRTEQVKEGNATKTERRLVDVNVKYCCPGYRNATGECLACSEGTFGEGCSSTCRCVSSNTLSCSKTDGTCTCKAGYQGSTCESKCDNWRFGERCQSSCPCRRENTERCDPVNGECTCRPGYIGEDCSRACDQFRFGLNCLETCRCQRNNTRSCDNKNGVCRCNAGYQGNTCNRKCNTGRFGSECASTCPCRMQFTQECNHVTGSCTCKPGYTGRECSEKCQTGQFGDNCTSRCRCNMTNTEVCDNVNGSCTCKSGYRGETCSFTCEPMYYGVQCESVCNCPDNAYPNCNFVTGQCTCRPGFYGPNCDNECSEGRFGVQCLGICSCIEEYTQMCNKGTGKCECKEGFIGETCGTSQIARSSISRPVLISLSVLGTLLVVAIILMILLKILGCSVGELKMRFRKDASIENFSDYDIHYKTPKHTADPSTNHDSVDKHNVQRLQSEILPHHYQNVDLKVANKTSDGTQAQQGKKPHKEFFPKQQSIEPIYDNAVVNMKEEDSGTNPYEALNLQDKTDEGLYTALKTPSKKKK